MDERAVRPPLVCLLLPGYRKDKLSLVNWISLTSEGYLVLTVSATENGGQMSTRPLSSVRRKCATSLPVSLTLLLSVGSGEALEAEPQEVMGCSSYGSWVGLILPVFLDLSLTLSVSLSLPRSLSLVLYQPCNANLSL